MLEILVGFIASGKSSYSRKRAKEGAIIINDDSMVMSLHGGDYSLYNKDLKVFYKSIENHIIAMGFASDLDVIIDRPNYKRSTRKRYIGIAKSFGMEVTIVRFRTEDSMVHAQRRFDSDPRGYSLEDWYSAVKRHKGLYQEPVRELEGFDSMIYE